MDKKFILDKANIELKLKRMALELAEQNTNINRIILAGIKDNGIIIAKKIQFYLKPLFSGEIQLIEISMDKKFPTEVLISENVNIDNAALIIIDDVANSGRTLMYALKPFLHQHPLRIQTLVLVERTHKKFPVHPDYVGLSLATTLQEYIYVEFKDEDINAVWME